MQEWPLSLSQLELELASGIKLHSEYPPVMNNLFVLLESDWSEHTYESLHDRMFVQLMLCLLNDYIPIAVGTIPVFTMHTMHVVMYAAGVKCHSVLAPCKLCTWSAQ